MDVECAAVLVNYSAENFYLLYAAIVVLLIMITVVSIVRGARKQL